METTDRYKTEIAKRFPQYGMLTCLSRYEILKLIWRNNDLRESTRAFVGLGCIRLASPQSNLRTLFNFCIDAIFVMLADKEDENHFYAP